MPQEPTIEPKSRDADRASPKCLLSWAIDPATGKPVARWTVAQPEKPATFVLKPAA